MNDPEAKHVFISYVREDADAVKALCSVLDAVQIPYWLDKAALGPGDVWQAKIKKAIRDGSLVFLACLSDNSRARSKSYMNEELTLAVEEFRQMPPGRVWLIPVRLDAGDVPEWDLGAGRSLSTLNWADLFGENYTANAARLVVAIRELMSEEQPDTATALAAVEQATAEDRVDVLRRLTKDMLPDPAKRIKLDDIVAQEVQRVLAVLNDSGWVAIGRLQGTDDEMIVQWAQEANALWELVQPFCASLQVAAQWGTPDQLSPWANGLRSFLAAAHQVEGGNTALLALRHLPAMVGIMTAALACGPSSQWANLRTLVVEPSVRDRNYNRTKSLVEATAPWKPFGDNAVLAHVLARATVQGQDFAEALSDHKGTQGKYYTPIAEWLHHVLRPLFADQLLDADSYDAEFDRAEVMLNFLAEDQASIRVAADPELSGRSWVNPWIGRSTWRTANGNGNPPEQFAHEIAVKKALWGPLQGNLFDGDQQRAEVAMAKTASSFNRASASRF